MPVRKFHNRKPSKRKYNECNKNIEMTVKNKFVA